jgi:hypothetical protein
MEPNQRLNQTYVAPPQVSVPTTPDNTTITMLAVPKSWTRLVMAAVILLFMVVGLVTFIVFIQYRSSQANTDRILDLQREIEQLRGEIHQNDPK